jgi:diguanylate cyclase (GGDEF)-like protein/PAS domain S-box-containing protein
MSMGRTADEHSQKTGRSGAAQGCAVAAALWEKEQLFRVLLEYSADCEIWIDACGVVRFVSPSFASITGYTPECLYRNPDYLAAIMVQSDLPAFRAQERILAERGGSFDVEVRIRTASGRERWVLCICRSITDDEGRPQGRRLTCRDVTRRRLLAMQLQHQAGHDPLTGLPNRSLFLEKLDARVNGGRAARDGGASVVMIDVDRFKQINDVLGHEAGDGVLRVVADRLRGILGGNDALCRLGGDEFCLLLAGGGRAEEVLARVQQIQQRLMDSVDTGGRRLHLTVSVGVATHRPGQNAPEDMMRNGGIALQHAKRAGGGGLEVFSDWMLESALNHAHLEMELHHALKDNAFHLEFQPLVDLHSGRPVRVEALARWDHPQRGAVSPADFIPVLEETGQILRLGSWVLENACMAAARWQRRHPELRSVGVSVNLSARQLAQPALVDQVAAVLSRSGLEPASLKLEVTETMLMDNPELSNLVLRRLKDLGVFLAIDDFGTGYSSLAYLQSFPIDTLKIDKSFVMGMTSDPGKFNIVKAVTALAHSLGLDVVAEGVEEQEQRIMLHAVGCEYAQGFLFARPVPEKDLAAQLGSLLRSSCDPA